jgi:hypothetical protein
VYVLASHVLSSHSYLYLHLRVHLRIKDTLLSVFPIKTPTRVIDGGEAQRERERERERDNGVLFSIIFVVSWVGGFSLFEEWDRMGRNNWVWLPPDSSGGEYLKWRFSDRLPEA